MVRVDQTENTNKPDPVKGKLIILKVPGEKRKEIFVIAMKTGSGTEYVLTRNRGFVKLTKDLQDIAGYKTLKKAKIQLVRIKQAIKGRTDVELEGTV